MGYQGNVARRLGQGREAMRKKRDRLVHGIIVFQVKYGPNLDRNCGNTEDVITSYCCKGRVVRTWW